MEKIIEVIGVDISQDGEGIAKTKEGYTVFVPYLLPREKAIAKLVQKGKRFGRAELVELIGKSNNRVVPRCSIYSECGGCQLQHLDYKAQLLWKEKKVKDSLSRIGGLVNPKVMPIVGMDNPWYYRNRGQFPVGKEDGEFFWGFFAPKTHKIVRTNECLIHHEYINEALEDLMFQLNQSSFHFPEDTLNHLVVRCGVNTQEVLVTMVLTEPLSNSSIPIKCSDIKRAVGIIENINQSKGFRVLGKKERTLSGRSYIEESLLNLRFLISSQSFFQNNTIQAEKLYQKVLDYANAEGKKVLELYSGIGSISLCLAQEAKEVIGVEIVQQAVEDAKKNADINNIRNVNFYSIDAKNIFTQKEISHDLLVVDPPRKGLEKPVVESILELEPESIVYASCNPDTLARDINLLRRKYNLVEVTPFDLFPQTTHVECVTLMSKVEK